MSGMRSPPSGWPDERDDRTLGNVAGLRPMLPLLDRLMDGEPDAPADRPLSAAAAEETMRSSIRRDLEALLNSRQRWRSWDSNYADLALSPAGFGLPDFAAGAFNDPGRREELRRLVETTIRRFEPRFASLAVTLLQADDTLSGTMRLRVEAVLNAQSIPEILVFDTFVDPVTTNVTVQFEPG
jgi:type VI secretion system protein ImpF